VEVTIGVQNLPRELVVETDETADKVTDAVRKALEGAPALELTDSRGRRIIVPTATIGYVEIGTEEQRRVGFGSL
jgi:phage tail sheath gpL-like